MIVIKMPRLMDLYPNEQPLYFKIVELRKGRILYELKMIGIILERNGISKEVISDILEKVSKYGKQKIEKHLPIPANRDALNFISEIVNNVLQEQLKIWQLTGIRITKDGHLVCEEKK